MANTQNLDLVKPLGTDYALVSVLNSNSDKIDAYAGAVNASLDGLRDGLGILADGNTHAAVTSGQFVYVKNHQTLPQGLYQATTNIAANGTLSTSNLTADPKGGLNTLSEQIGNLGKGLFSCDAIPASAVTGKRIMFYIPYFTGSIPNITISQLGVINLFSSDAQHASRCTLISKSIHGASFRYDDTDNIFASGQAYVCNLEYTLS